MFNSEMTVDEWMAASEQQLRQEVREAEMMAAQWQSRARALREKLRAVSPNEQIFHAH